MVHSTLVFYFQAWFTHSLHSDLFIYSFNHSSVLSFKLMCYITQITSNPTVNNKQTTCRCRHNAKIITFFRAAKRYIVSTHFVYVTKLFTSRSELFTNCFCCCTALFRLFCCLSRRKLIWFWFECCYNSAKPSVEGHISHTTQLFEQ